MTDEFLKTVVAELFAAIEAAIPGTPGGIFVHQMEIAALERLKQYVTDDLLAALLLRLQQLVGPKA